MLEQAVGEAARARADVEAGRASRVDGEVAERRLHLQPTASDVAIRLLHRDGGIFQDLRAGLVDALFADGHVARHDRALRLLPALAQAAGDEQLIEADLQGGVES